jgi:hypothetical protein
MVRYLREMGQLDKLKGLITVDGVGSTFASSGTTAADYVSVPYLSIRGYYPGLSDGVYTTNVNAIKTAGGTAEFISLADPVYGDQFKGVTHMMMMGNGHLQVMDVILNWARKNIPNQPQKNSCSPGKSGR